MSFNLVKPNRLWRGMAMLLLALVFVDLIIIDLAFPQFRNDGWCEFLSGDPIDYAAQISDEAFSVSSRGSAPNHNSLPPMADEDCFSSCSHVLPGGASHEVIPEMMPRIHFLTNHALPLAPPDSLFHPPRRS